jgi:hypothetical protein
MNNYITAYKAEHGIINIINDFQRFDELQLGCNKTYNISENIMFSPNKPIVLDKSFNLKEIFLNEEFIKVQFVQFIHLKGIDIDVNKIDFFFQSSIEISFSKLDFYNNTKIINKQDCKINLFKNLHSIFSEFTYVILVYDKFPEFLCPYVFMNSSLYKIGIFDVSNSYLNKNRINFLEVDDIYTKVNSILSFVRYLRIQLKYESMTRKILNRYVFKYMENIRIEGVLVDIESDLLTNFIYLKYIDITIQNFRSFFHQGNNWLKYLNKGVKVDLNDMKSIKRRLNEKMLLRFEYTKQATSFDQIYEYPEEDFCLFKDFPHDHLVYPIIIPGQKINCSCTIIWLLKYYYFYTDLNVHIHDYIDNYNTLELEDTSLLGNILYCVDKFQKCGFDSLTAKCNKSNNEKISAFNIDSDMDVFYLIKSLQFILLIVLNPIFCFFGIINNLLTIIVISNKKMKKDFKDPMYKHIRINAFFNIIYCVIMLLKLINQCLFYTSDLYCSSLFTSTISQYFKIYVINFFGNVIKMSTNFSYIFFSISRYTLVSNKTKGFLKKFIGINMKKFYFMLILFCLLISLFKAFQYKPNYKYRQEKDFPYEYYDDNRCKLKHTFLCDFFNSMKIFNNVINDIVFVCINIIFDLLLLKQFRENLKHKDKIKANSDKDKLDQKKQKDHINKMVIVNSILYLTSHMPEFVVSILLIIYTRKISNFCLNNLSCDLINEEAEFFNIMSIVFQFHVFKAFNKKFSESYLDLKKRFFRLIFFQK